MKTRNISVARLRKYRKLKKLVQKWIRCDVLARSPAISFPMYGDFFRSKLDTEDELRELLYDTKDIIEIGRLIGVPVDPPRRKKKVKHAKKTKAKRLRHSSK